VLRGNSSIDNVVKRHRDRQSTEHHRHYVAAVPARIDGGGIRAPTSPSPTSSGHGTIEWTNVFAQFGERS
jgi:hypothetical protein